MPTDHFFCYVALPILNTQGYMIHVVSNHLEGISILRKARRFIARDCFFRDTHDHSFAWLRLVQQCQAEMN